MAIRKWGNEQFVTAENFSSGANDKLWDVAALDDGGYVVVWLDKEGVIDLAKGQRYDARGVKVGAEFEIGAAQSSADKVDIAVSGRSGGGFAVTFTVATNANDTYIQIFDAAGASAGALAVDIQATPEEDIAIARVGTGFAFAETDTFNGTEDVWLRKFDSNGAAVGSFVDFTSAAAGAQRAVAITAFDNDARIVTAWFDNQALQYRFRISDSNLGSLSSVVTVRQTDAIGDGDYPPTVVALQDGNFAYIWHMNQPSDSSDTSGYGTFACIYDRTGAAVSGEIRVNGLINGLQARFDATATADGGFFVAFTDERTSQREMTGRAFDAEGNPLGPQVQINTTTDGSDQDAKLATLSDGRIIALWHSGASGTAGLRTQIIDTRDGIVFGKNNSTGEETLYGHDLINDEINGLGGVDRIFGLGGSDALYGGDGNDVLEGGKGDDFLYGGRDTDSLRGGDGDDKMYGEAGNDTLVGSNGADLMDGGDGTDSADYRTSTTGVTVSLDGTLTATGWALGDTFVSIETLNGSTTGSDILRGDGLSNTLFGNGGVDILEGGGGNDRLVGGTGIDTLTGGANNDRFDFNNLTEIGDFITDFTAVNDSIYVSAAGFGGGLVAGTLGAAQFESLATNVATAPGTRFIFRTTDQTLWYDADGNLGGAAVMVADLQAGATMTNADIIVF